MANRSEGAAEHRFVGAAGRGLAQVEIELGNLQAAVAVIDRIHSRMAPHPFGLMLSALEEAGRPAIPAAVGRGGVEGVRTPLRAS